MIHVSIFNEDQTHELICRSRRVFLPFVCPLCLLRQQLEQEWHTCCHSPAPFALSDNLSDLKVKMRGLTASSAEDLPAGDILSPDLLSDRRNCRRLLLLVNDSHEQRMPSPKSAELPPVNSPSSRFEHRQVSLDDVVSEDHDDEPGNRMDEVTESPRNSHMHHHLRHHHSIYSRNHSYQGKRFSVDGNSGCNRQSCSCSLLIRPESTSPSPICRSQPATPQPVSPALPGNGAGDGDEFFASDHIDSLPPEMSFTWFDIIALVTSIVTFLGDIGTDTVVAAFHLHNGDYWYFSLTVAFIAIPTLIVTGISLRWYVLDAREAGSPPISKFKWATRVTFLLLQLGPIVRYVDSLIYGLKFRKSSKNRSEQKKYYQYMVYEGQYAICHISRTRHQCVAAV